MHKLTHKHLPILQAVGLAHLDAASHLCLHPKYGPWFSLRALLVFDGVPFHGAPAWLVNASHCTQAAVPASTVGSTSPHHHQRLGGFTLHSLALHAAPLSAQRIVAHEQDSHQARPMVVRP